MISFIIPSYNNLKHLKNAYNSIKKHSPQSEICIADDSSIDGTTDWLKSIYEVDNNVKYITTQIRNGHTILYDTLINEISTNDIFIIFHADMILSENCIDNMLKHLKKGTVVCATRVEPPLHPKGNEKIIMDFGDDFDNLDIDAFEMFSKKIQLSEKDKTTSGMFAPWMMYKSDFQEINGHDPIFKPFPYEDSDIFNRMLLNGYELIQSRDALVYHLTCRGHRWNNEIGKDDLDFKIFEERSRRNYLRKWGRWIRNDSYMKPIVYPRYRKLLNINNSNSIPSDKLYDLINLLEPWFDYVNVDMNIAQSYIDNEQPNTDFNLSDKFNIIDSSDINVDISTNTFSQQEFDYITMLPQIIQDSGQIGEFSLGMLKINIVSMEDHNKELIIRK